MVSGAYKGKMHRLKNAPPRQWPMPPRTITVEQFRELTRRRDQKQDDNPTFGGSSEVKKEEGELKEPEEVGAILDHKGKILAADLDDLDISNADGKMKVLKTIGVKGSDIRTNDGKEEISNADGKVKVSKASGVKGSDIRTNDGKEISNADGKVKVSKTSGVKESDIRTNDGKEEISNADGKPKVSKANGVKESDVRTNDGKEEVISIWTAEKEQRRLEVEKKLAAAKEKKHNLVQMLKMILNAEEEIKRRNVLSAATHAWVPTQGETTADMGSASRLVPKLSVEVNFSGDQGTESDGTACHSSQGQQITKPFVQNMQRSSLTTSGAATTRPSIFAPSPGASGGASVSNFKDTRRTASSS